MVNPASISKQNSFLNYIFTLGVESGQSFSKKRNIIFTNQSIFILVVIFPCVALADFVTGNYWRMIGPLVATAVVLWGFMLQDRRQYFWSRMLAVFCPLIAAVVSSIIFGTEAKEHYYLFPILILALFNFQNALGQIALFLIHFLALTGVLYFDHHYEPYIAGQDSVSLGYFQLLFILLIVYIAISQFGRHTEQYNRRINKLLCNIKDQQLELEKQRDHIEQQAQKLQRINHHLEKEIGNKDQAQQQALESNQELESFAYVASHDLKEPLRTIGSFIQLIKRRSGKHFDKESNTYFEFVTDGVKRMSNLLDDLLSLSRLNKRIEFSTTNLCNTVELTLHNLKQLLERSDGDVIFQSLPTLQANKTQMNQLFQNLISNGIKFKKPEVPPRIIIDVADQGDKFLFTVKDNGIGIAKEHQERVFTLFQRLHTRDEYEGTGIGLTLCKKIINNHGGRVWIESTPNIGTTFYFTLAKNPGKNHLNTINSKVNRQELSTTSS